MVGLQQKNVIRRRKVKKNRPDSTDFDRSFSRKERERERERETMDRIGVKGDAVDGLLNSMRATGCVACGGRWFLFFFLIFKNFFSPLSFFFFWGKKEKKLRPLLPWPGVVSNRRIVYRVFSSSRTLAEFFCDELVLWFLLGSVISSFS